MKPDSSQVGQFTLVEGTGPFAGCYFFDYLSQTSDPQGEYKVAIGVQGRKFTQGFSLYSVSGSNPDLTEAIRKITNAANLIAISVI